MVVVVVVVVVICASCTANLPCFSIAADKFGTASGSACLRYERVDVGALADTGNGELISGFGVRACSGERVGAATVVVVVVVLLAASSVRGRALLGRALLGSGAAQMSLLSGCMCGALCVFVRCE